MAILLGIFEEGLIYAIMALGVYITYKILDFPDLSVDGTFPWAQLTAGLIVESSISRCGHYRSFLRRRARRMRDQALFM